MTTDARSFVGVLTALAILLASCGRSENPMAAAIRRKKEQADSRARRAATHSERVEAESESQIHARQLLYADRQLHTTIVGDGATQAQAGDAPYQVGLIDTKFQPQEVGWLRCGGTLIAPTWVLTAAHCVAGLKEGDIAVLVGTRKLSGGRLVSVRKIYPYSPPPWDPYTNVSDIALLQLNDTVKSSEQQPARLVDKAKEAVFRALGKQARISGWGYTSEGAGHANDDLMYVDVPLRDTVQCNAAMSGRILAGMMCAGGDGTGDTCGYDSGGPLAFKDGSEWFILGITSWGIRTNCNRKGEYGVYTREAEYYDWITPEIANGPA